MACTLSLAAPVPVHALPVGGVVSAGAASIGGTAGSMTITQSTPNVAINWQGFDVAPGEGVRFVQPDRHSVALNRVLGADPSSILGRLSANGNVFLVNPNGILFGPGAAVNVGGLLAATLNITDRDLMAGRYKFSATGGMGSTGDTGQGAIINQGTIATHADGGYVLLLGAKVSNDGIIVARRGTVALVAGSGLTLDVAGDGLLNITVQQGAVNALVQNGGLIQADGGQVLLSAQALNHLLPSVVNNTGVIEAHSVEQHNGTIKLLGDTHNGTVNVSGRLDASGLGDGQTGGTLQVLGQTVNLAEAVLNASGDVGGGRVLLGGNFQGAGPEQNAQRVTLDGGVAIHADAIKSGKGGRIAVWSDGSTSVGGTLTARGGANSGDGGFIETSGTHLSIADNMHLDTLAPYGKAGTWLLDPKDFNIAVAGGDITGITLSHNLLAANVTISSSDGAIGSTGNIHVNTEVHWAGATTLTLNAVHDVLVDAAIIADTAGAKLVLIAGNDVAIAAPMTVVAAGSSIAINAGNDVRVGGAITSTAANSAVDIRAGHDVSTSAALKAIAADSAITIHAGNDLYVGAAITGIAANTVIDLGAGRDAMAAAAITAIAADSRIGIAAGRDVTTTTTAAITAGAATTVIELNAGRDVNVNAAIAASAAGSAIRLIAGLDGKGPGVAAGTVRLIGALASPNITLRFNPDGYARTSAELAHYPALADAKAWVFAQGESKTYDGTNTASLSFKGAPADGGAVTLVSGTAAFATKSAGTEKTITFNGYSLGGADAGKFALFAGSGMTTANIAQRPLTVTVSDANKIYDGTLAYMGNLADNRIVGDALTLSYAAAHFGDKNVGNGKGLSVTGINATGNDAANYNVISALATTANITPAPLTVTAANARKTYGQIPILTAFTSAGLVNGETIGRVSATSPGSVATASVLGGPYAITPSNANGGTFTATNYRINYLNGALTVAPAPLTVTVANITKIYGQTPILTAFTHAGLMNGESIDAVTESSPGAAATASVAGSPYVITPGIATGGTFTASNYSISYVNGALTVLPLIPALPSVVAPKVVPVTADEEIADIVPTVVLARPPLSSSAAIF